MSVLFNHAMLWELIEIQANPMKLVKIPDASKRKEEPRVLTVEEFHMLLAQIEAEPQCTMVILAMCLGLRCSELIGLQWQDFDWENLTLLVRRAVVASHVDQVKTRYSKKNLPLDPSVSKVVKRWFGQSQYRGPKDWVFASPFMDGRLTLSLSVSGRSATPYQARLDQGWPGSDRVARSAPYLSNFVGPDWSSDFRTTGTHGACGHRHYHEHLWRCRGGESEESQQQGNRAIAAKENWGKIAFARSMWGLLDLFGPACNPNDSNEITGGESGILNHSETANKVLISSQAALLDYGSTW
jgi:hypothetical protein